MLWVFDFVYEWLEILFFKIRDFWEFFLISYVNGILGVESKFCIKWCLFVDGLLGLFNFVLLYSKEKVYISYLNFSFEIWLD